MFLTQSGALGKMVDVTMGEATKNARSRARAELTQEIKEAGRRQLREVGAASLSLRAVARDVGMVSSAVYRYFPSRDDLLTALIVDAYDALGEAAETAGRAHADHSSRASWLAVCRAVRWWAQQHRHEYELIFGTPVPGYRAPQDTIRAAARVPVELLRIVRSDVAVRDDARDAAPLPAPVVVDLARLRDQAAPELDDRTLARAVMAWTMLIGAISFEFFGHLNNVIDDNDAWFDYVMGSCADDLHLQNM
jgi:AcrR family transcriptional regulator